MDGITSLAPGQAGQMQAPPPKQPGTPAAQVGALSSIPLEQLIQLAQNPNPNGPPLYAVISAISEKQKQRMAQEAMQRQMAMGQGQQQGQQPPVAQQVVQQAQQGIAQPRTSVADYHRQAAALSDQGKHAEAMRLLELAKEQEQEEFTRQEPRYAGGGIVALQRGGFVPGFATGANEFGLQSSEASALDELRVAEAQKAQKVKLLKDQLEFLERSGAPQAEIVRRELESLQGAPETRYVSRRDFEDRGFVPSGIVSSPPPQQRPPAGTGIAKLPMQATPATPATPAGPDRLSEIEAEYAKQSSALQDLLGKQGQVDPRIIAARREAAELASKSLTGREARAAQALEEARKQTTASLFDNQEALLRMAGAMGGKKRFGDALSAAAGEAGTVRGEQRKAFEIAQRENRLEQDALDTLRQAQVELKLRQTEGDVAGERDAARKVEEAKANLLLTRLNIQKERAAEEYRKGQTETEKEKVKVSREAIAAANARATQRANAAVAAAVLKGNKPGPLPGYAELGRLDAMVAEKFNPRATSLSPEAIQFLNATPSGKQLVADIKNKNIKPGTEQWEKQVVPKLEIAAQLYKQSLQARSKYGAQPMPYSAAASMLGVPSADEDED